MPRRLLLSLPLCIAACSAASTSGPGNETVASLHAGTSQTSFAYATLPVQPAVLITLRGEPVAGVTVTFRVTQGGGTVQGATQVTGSDGVARVGGWTLGVAGPQALEAVIGDALGSPVVFSATAVQSAPAVVSVVRGSGINGTVGLPVDVTPALRVTDAGGRPLAGIPVSWTISAGGGGFRYADIVTDDQGIAGVVKWILGTSSGTNTVTARVDCGVSCPAVTFFATAAPGPVYTMQITQGDLQRVNAGSAVPVAPTVRIRDSYGNTIAGRAVTFTVVQGDGIVTGGATTSDETGLARPTQWTLGPGENLLRAEAEGVSVLFRATGAL
jgi:hypothetical protein